MSFTSKCPRCHQPVTVPDGIDPHAEVRCPLCEVVYLFGEALAEVPPALIPVDPDAVRSPQPESCATIKPDVVSEPSQVPEPDGASEEVEGATEVDPDLAGQASPAIDTGHTPVDTDALAAFSVQQSDDESGPVDLGAAPRPRRKKNEKGAVRFILEVFAGGALGLLIGYYALCWILGPQHGLPKLPLPLLPHTMEATIDWFGGRQDPDNSPRQPSPEKSDAPKRPSQSRPDVPPVRSPAEPPDPE